VTKATQNKPAARRKLERPKTERSTRTGTGSALLEGVDGRSWHARRFREICADYAEHLGGDPTAPQQAVIRRAAQLEVWAEAAEAAYANGEDFSIESFTTASNALRRLLVDLGLERKARDITPSLSEYIAHRETVA
jgi:hypothetical protein